VTVKCRIRKREVTDSLINEKEVIMAGNIQQQRHQVQQQRHEVPFLDWLESGSVTRITPAMVAAELDRAPQQAQSVGLNGWGCLHVAAYNLKGSMTDAEIRAIVELLVERGADRDLLDIKGRRAVCYAAEKGLPETTSFLMQSAAHPDAIQSISARTPAGLNLFHYAAVSCNAQVVDLLVSFFPRDSAGLAQLNDAVNATTRQREIPAHYAARSGSQAVLAALERLGSLPALNRARQTPRDILPLP
jgi:hypothetical protein